MKKTIMTVLALAMVGAMTVTASAESATLGKNGEKNVDVNAMFVDSTNTPDSYSVDVEWGAMNFTYTIKGDHVWDKDTHQYNRDDSNDGWTASDNTIKVTNHSNKGVTAGFAFEKETNDDITGTFDYDKSLVLESAVGKEVQDADSVTATLTLSGVMSENTTNSFGKIGCVKVSLS